MSVELLYTSAPQGLKQGSRGFATVLCTSGLPSNLATRLEGLSGYRHVFPPNHAEASNNPVCYSHMRFVMGGKSISIISRISDYGIDYSQRTNKLAHHIVLDPTEQPAAGPAWLLAQPAFMRTAWDGSCQVITQGPKVPQADQSPGVCHTWEKVMGDAGWGGFVADAFLSTSPKPTWIVFKLEQSGLLLKLLDESIALLPATERWRATFSTYVTNLPPEADCKVRCVLEGSDEARQASAKGGVIKLTEAACIKAESATVLLARSGRNRADDPVDSTSSIRKERAERDSADESREPAEVCERTRHEPIAKYESPPSLKPVIRPNAVLPTASTDASETHKNYNWIAVSAISAVAVSILAVLTAFLLSRQTTIVATKQMQTVEDHRVNLQSNLTTESRENVIVGSDGSVTERDATKEKSRSDHVTPADIKPDHNSDSRGTQIIDGGPLSETSQQTNDSEPALKNQPVQSDQAEDSHLGNGKQSGVESKNKVDEGAGIPASEYRIVLEKALEGELVGEGDIQLPFKTDPLLWIGEGPDSDESWGHPLKSEGDEFAVGKGDIEKWRVKNGILTLKLNVPELKRMVRAVENSFREFENCVSDFNSNISQINKLTLLSSNQKKDQNTPNWSIAPLRYIASSDSFFAEIESNQIVAKTRTSLRDLNAFLQTALQDEKNKGDAKEQIAILSNVEAKFEQAVKAGKDLQDKLNRIKQFRYSRPNLIRVKAKGSGSFRAASGGGKWFDAEVVPISFVFIFDFKTTGKKTRK